MDSTPEASGASRMHTRNKSCDIMSCEHLTLDVGLATCMSEPDGLGRGDPVLAPQASLTAAHLPETAVRRIATYALQTGGRQNSVLQLLVMCGVCKHWRSAVSYLEPGLHLVFDGLKAGSPDGREGASRGKQAPPSCLLLEQRYRRRPRAERMAALLAAANLLRGYSTVTLTGDAVDDRLLLAVAQNPHLEAVTVTSCPNVSDIGLATLTMCATHLRSLSIADTSETETFGIFLSKALELPRLAKLELCTPLLDLDAVLDGHHTPRKLPMLSWQPNRSLQHLVLGSSTIQGGDLVQRLPNLRIVELEGAAVLMDSPGLDPCHFTTLPPMLHALAAACPLLNEVHFSVDQPVVMNAALSALRRMRALSTLSVSVASFILDERQMALLGDLPLADLRLLSAVYKKQPTMPRPCCSHLDNSGVKAFVDAVCKRSLPPNSAAPLKLSMCGASLLTHDAVSAILRLPMLVGLSISGCTRIVAMDKMRLIAKIKAGREQLAASGGSGSAAHLGDVWQ